MSMGRFFLQSEEIPSTDISEALNQKTQEKINHALLACVSKNIPFLRRISGLRNGYSQMKNNRSDVIISLFKHFISSDHYKNFPFCMENNPNPDEMVIEQAQRFYQKGKTLFAINMLLLMGLCGSYRCMMQASEYLFFYFTLPQQNTPISSMQKSDYIKNLINAAYYLALTSTHAENDYSALAIFYWKYRVFFSRYTALASSDLRPFLLDVLQKAEPGNGDMNYSSHHTNSQDFIESFKDVNENNLQLNIELVQNFAYAIISDAKKRKLNNETISIDDYQPEYCLVFFNANISFERSLEMLKNLNFIISSTDRLDTREARNIRVAQIQSIVLPIMGGARHACIAGLLTNGFDVEKFNKLFSNPIDRYGALTSVLKDRELIERAQLEPTIQSLASIENEPFRAFIVQEAIESFFNSLIYGLDTSVPTILLCQLFLRQSHDINSELSSYISRELDVNEVKNISLDNLGQHVADNEACLSALNTILAQIKRELRPLSIHVNTPNNKRNSGIFSMLTPAKDDSLPPSASK